MSAPGPRAIERRIENPPAREGEGSNGGSGRWRWWPSVACDDERIGRLLLRVLFVNHHHHHPLVTAPCLFLMWESKLSMGLDELQNGAEGSSGRAGGRDTRHLRHFVML